MKANMNGLRPYNRYWEGTISREHTQRLCNVYLESECSETGERMVLREGPKVTTYFAARNPKTINHVHGIVANEMMHYTPRTLSGRF